MKFSFYIAKRYLFSSGSAQAINIITRIAASAIVVGAIILFVVLSAFDGLKDLHLEFTSIADPELKVFPKEGKFFTVTDVQKKQIKAIDGVVDLPAITVQQIQHFFEHDKDLEPDKWVKILGLHDADTAKKLIRDAIERA